MREYTLILENLSVHHLDQPLFFGLLTHQTIMLLVASNDAGVSFPASLCVVSKLYVFNVKGQDSDNRLER